MSAWYMLMDPRYGVYPYAKAPGTVGRSMGSMAGRLPLLDSIRVLVSSVATKVSLALLRSRVIRELESLDDRLLADIGLNRFDIAKTVDAAAGQIPRRQLRIGLPTFQIGSHLLRGIAHRLALC